MAGGKLSLTITAVDQVSEHLEAINKRIAAMAAPVERVQKSFKRLSDASGLTRMSEGFRNLGAASGKVFHNVARIVEPLSAITSAASIAGLVALTTKFAGFGSQLSFTGQRIGMSASALQTWQNSARLAGTSGAAMAQGMQTLGQNLWNAIGGRSPQTVATFQYLGFKMSDIVKMSHNLNAAMPQLADKIAAIQNPFGQAAVATALFGGAAEDMLPFLRLGSKGMAEYEAEAKKYGVVNAAGVTAANNLRIAQTSLTLAVEGLGYSVAEKLAPYLGPLLTNMANWIARNRAWIATGIVGAVKSLVGWVEKVAPEVQSAVHEFGGWQKAARDLAIFMGAAWLASMMAPILTVTAALVRVVSLMAATGISTGAGAAGLVGTAAGAATMLGGGLVAGGMLYMMNTPDPDPVNQGTLGRYGRYGITGPNAPPAFGTARGLRDNNPLNLKTAGMAGTVGADGPFGKYATMQAGATAGAQQLVRDNTVHGLHTLRALITDPKWGWAPASDGNDDPAYLKAVTGMTGIGADAPLDLTNASNLRKVLSAMAQEETGATLDPTIASNAAAQAVQITVDVNHNNAPPGSSVVVSASSPSVSQGAVKISRAMAGGGI
ncbi:hypothetical protein [Acidocella sp.]|uniref:hypothetical protein n=1 Tax=Acidocella sp. TaxID=50710 RepID=UPI00261AB168|nr:hypothetical protein [Acidocella sp.]